MSCKETEPEKHDRRLYLGFAVVTVLIVVLIVAFFSFRDPLLYGNTLTVQAVTDKSSYMQGEDVSILANVINGKNEPVNVSTAVSYKVFDSTGEEIYSCTTLITLPIPLPTFSAHSRTSYDPHIWNQKDSNFTLVEPGIYTIEVSLEYGSSECEIVIA